jgi:DNA polymerase-4
MDAFYASVETLDQPELAGRPVIVGASGARSVVCACSYEARKFGVRSAMSMREARELCPRATFVRPRMARYAEISRAMFHYLESEAPLVEKTSIDEGYLDISGVAPNDEAALELGRRLKKEIRDRFGLVCSVGIGPCKFVSKIASDLEKPDALVLAPEADVLEFLAPLGVDRIPGVGKVGTKKLRAIGVRTIGDLRRQGREALGSMFGKWGGRLHDFARGIDPRPVVAHHERKSLGREKTFERDLLDLEPLRETLAEQSARIAKDLEAKGLFVRTVVVKARYSNFQLITRRRTFSRPIQRAAQIASIAQGILANRTEAGRRPIRLVGVSVSGFVPSAGEQGELPLFPATQ